MAFVGSVVIVTGASAGIGEAIAVSFCKEGANVALVGRNQANLKKVSDRCSQAGGKNIIIKADVTNDGDAKRIISETIKQFGKLDVLVNNAGVVASSSILNGTFLEAYDKVINTNLRSVIHLTMLATPHLVKTKGNIVNISSIAGQMNFHVSFSAYCTSKAGLDHFTRGVALELAPSGVRVNNVSPGPVKTGIFEAAGIDNMRTDLDHMPTPLGRISEPDEIADLVIFLASDKAKGITGSTFVSDNGILLK